MSLQGAFRLKRLMASERSLVAAIALSMVGLVACSGQTRVFSDGGGAEATTSHRDGASEVPDASAMREAGPPVDAPSGEIGCGDASTFDAGATCDPYPCAPGQFCVNANGVNGQGSFSRSYCEVFPACCTSTPTCSCLEKTVAFAQQCTVDGGAITVTTVLPAFP
jgi:hypothetical protein